MASASMQEEAYAVQLGLKDAFLQPPNETSGSGALTRPPQPPQRPL